MVVTPGSEDPRDGRTRRRIAAMRRVQSAALDLFEIHGFAAVTIEAIAAAAEVGPATIYRNFGTKEQIVLWDDYDPALFRTIGARLGTAPVVTAVRDGLIEALGPIYVRDRERILRRSRLLVATEALRASVAANLAALRTELAALLVAHRAARAGLAADVVAAAVVGALEAAIAHWVRGEGRAALATVMRQAFGHLAHLALPPA